jgi:hypothetical protein
MADLPENTGGFWQGFYSIADKFAAPVVNKFLVGDTGNTLDEQSMIEERRRINRLNGSGPNDEVASAGSPRSFWEFITGNRTTSAGGSAGGSMLVPLLLVAAVVGFIAWRMARR